MPVSDALVVGEGWISEHYFTTDATKESFQAKVVERRKAWDVDKEGPTTRSRFSAARAELLSVLATLAEDDDRLPGLYETVEKVLGYHRVGLKLDHHGPVVHVHAAGLTGAAPLAIVHARPCESVEDLLAKDAQTLLGTWEPDEGDAETSAARMVSRLFTAAEHPDFVLVLAGGFALVAERERWAEGRYLLVDLQLVCERNEDKKYGEVDRALACLDAESLAPDADGNVWWRQPLEESVRHTVGVSSDLREGVRLSIEIIANEVVARRAQQGLDPLPADQAQPLARQSLRFLYRILFLLYAEASPELGVLPVGAPEYERGYSLDRLRDLTLVQLATPAAEQGTHLHDSLDVLFRLVDQGHAPKAAAPDAGTEGLTFRSLKADLFLPEAVGLISEVRLGNAALQRVLQHLLLSKEKKGNDRGFISYAELGINQLGAVYEGLMSYTGFFATEDLHEVAKGGDASKGSWVVPTHRSDGIAASDFVMETDEHTGEKRPVVHERGSFVYRLAGRERQQSASYYTPEVLTKFVVSQALEELLDQDGTTSAREILDLTVCEPALGSGAFAIEAVRQLAAEYLTRRQAETGETIDPDDYPRELQKVKAYLALHQVHGVDLNATAVELAEISLWLDTMVEGLEAPWFGLHLRRGNSLVGARRSVYRTDHLKGKAWLKTVPIDKPLHDPEASTEGTIHHFLLPADGWGAAVDAKEGKELAPEAVARLKAWRKSVLKTPTKAQEKALLDIARRVEVLWSIAARRLEVAEQQIRRSIDVWSADDLPGGGTVTREQIEQSLEDAGSAYRRLKLVMDAWCALWFWPLTETLTTVAGEIVAPPSLEDWIDALQGLVGSAGRVQPGNQLAFTDVSDWDALGEAEARDLEFAGVRRVESLEAQHPWLVVAQKLAEQHGFFHWELDFSSVFRRGGFDLQVGNPPWVRPRSDVEALLAEGDPWWQLKAKATQQAVAARREATLEIPGMAELLVDGTTDVASLAAYVGSPVAYPFLAGLQPDLYRCFMERTWRNQSDRGAVALIHPETHFTDEKAGPLRQATYERLRRHWQFVNELQLFEVHHLMVYGVHVYGAAGEPAFMMATSLYHPDTVERSLGHDGSGDEPGIRDATGNWDLRPHADRLVEVTDEVLSTWRAALENADVPVRHTRMVYTVNRSTSDVLAKLARAPRLSELGLEFSAGWHEKNDRTKGYFDAQWGRAATWDDVILQGPHLFVSLPFFKSPNRTMLHQQDWSIVDLESIPSDALPITSYKPVGDRARYYAGYTKWGKDGDSAQNYFRIAWRNMAANNGERTLISAVIPPGAAHVDGIFSMGGERLELSQLLEIQGYMSSLIVDFAVRVAPKSTIRSGTAARLPFNPAFELASEVRSRVARLVCLTDAYGELWAAATDQRWTPEAPLRNPRQRRQAQLEIDALSALALELTADELCAIYRTQFPVLFDYDRKVHHYDAIGRIVPNSVLTSWRKKGDRISEEERTATHPAGTTYTYELPFVTLDREADMRRAYAHFEERLRDES
ncbi:methylase of polypeptide subunit release factors [Aeromicrobium sp. SORGH_AS981]|uniref:Eco57I restriction-modification methylase domain-containing protein n=1 Tax=Aeromicrobium sp. SORGH_AS_0981 TaxID=3041802 RepID=UPI00286552DC|nr:class I SAM-dependent DNA methyltransferase [Aeromicrobium sp. SORGH_AS_0981]MDR6119714.1 methylase of polypeptide subunit release factors [Aeromicrobium sp. SORGH_AS_0981]